MSVHTAILPADTASLGAPVLETVSLGPRPSVWTDDLAPD
jgi:hypothetical protein